MKHTGHSLAALLLALGVTGCASPSSEEQSDAVLTAYEDQRKPEAQTNLGVLYLDGRGVPQDPTEAVRWFKKAAELGKMEAQSNLAVAYRNGRGAPQDDVEATKLFLRAAEQGDASSQYATGYAYYAGFGTPEDAAQAASWFRRAAAQGYAQAHMWFNLAAASAMDDGTRNLAVKNREVVAAAMTPTQIAEAQKLAREWQPGP